MDGSENDTLTELQAWYLADCDGSWEHRSAIAIGTLDNPDWSVKVDLEATALATLEVETVKLERSEDDWLFLGSSCR